MVKLVYTRVLGARALRRGGSSPLIRTNEKDPKVGLFHWFVERTSTQRCGGENYQWQFARQPSLESYAFKAEVAGPQNVGKSSHPHQIRDRSSDRFLIVLHFA